MEMRVKQVDQTNLKLVFLDVMEYLNKNAYNVADQNFKGLIYQAIYDGHIVKNEYTKVMVKLCDARNDIAHGNSTENDDLNEKRLIFIYTTGLYLLGLYSKKVDIQNVNNDVYFIENNKPVFRRNKLVDTFKTKKLIYLFDDFF